jgi:hypothetical protein
MCIYTVDSRYLEFDGTMEKIWVNRSSTQEELRKYRKCSLFNDERETTRVKFWRAKTSIACPYSRNDFKHIRCFCCCFFLSVKFFESCGTIVFFYTLLNSKNTQFIVDKQYCTKKNMSWWVKFNDNATAEKQTKQINIFIHTKKDI